MDNTKTRLLQPTVAREQLSPRGSFTGWCLMNRQVDGWRSSCVEFNTILEIWQEFDIKVGKSGEDEFGQFIEIIPN